MAKGSIIESKYTQLFDITLNMAIYITCVFIFFKVFIVLVSYNQNENGIQLLLNNLEDRISVILGQTFHMILCSKN